MLVEARVDFDNREVVIFDVQTDTEIRSPGARLRFVTIVPDSDGAILQGVLIEQVNTYYPERERGVRRASFTRAGLVVDRANQRTVRSCYEAVVKPGTVYYVED